MDNGDWSKSSPGIQILTGVEAIRKRPSMYVGKCSDNGLNAVSHVTRYAMGVVCRGGEAFIRYGNGYSPMVVRTFETIDLDLNELLTIHNSPSFRSFDIKEPCSIEITKALCYEFKLIHFTKEKVSFNIYSCGKLKEQHEIPNSSCELPGIQFNLILDLNLVHRVSLDDFIMYLAMNPHFHWNIEMEDNVTERIPIYRGLKEKSQQ
jgi:hypothetical protein